MTVLVSVKVNDGLVLAADSASSFGNGMVYYQAEKIVNLHAGLPLAAMVTGAGGIGSESIDTLLKDLRARFEGRAGTSPDDALDPAAYSVQDVAARVRACLLDRIRAQASAVHTRVRICGYSAGRPLAEVWEVLLTGDDATAPACVQAEHEFGLRWDGEYEALSRLVFGLGTGFDAAAVAAGMPAAQAEALRGALVPRLTELLFIEAMPMRDAVDLARFLVQTTIGFVRFAVNRPKLVGGAIAIATVTKHDGFRWVQAAAAGAQPG